MADSASAQASTTSDLPEGPRGFGERWGVRAGLLLLVLVVAAGAVGLLGPLSATTSATGFGYHLEVSYPSITRAGEPAPLHVRVTSEDGFDGPLELAFCDDFFDNLDFQSWYPTPSAETGERGRLVYEFDAPRVPTFEVSLDARSAPGPFGGVEECTVSVLEAGSPVVSVDFRTWRMP